MEETPAFELPSPSEKLAFKFIIDSLRENAVVEESAVPTHDSSQQELETPLEAPPREEPATIVFEPLVLPADKKYFRIREVTELTGVEPYVLRYWESEFSTVRPSKSGTGQRVYSRRDVEELDLIRHLLHVEKFSIKGAKQKLQERRQNRASTEVKAAQVSRQKQTQFLRELTHELRDLIQAARANPGLAGA